MHHHAQTRYYTCAKEALRHTAALIFTARIPRPHNAALMRMREHPSDSSKRTGGGRPRPHKNTAVILLSRGAKKDKPGTATTLSACQQPSWPC